MRAEELDFNLPKELIATRPAEPRDSARLMVVRLKSGGDPGHHHVRDLPSLLSAGDLLALNDTRVLPARFEGTNLDTGGGVGGLWLRDAQQREREAASIAADEPGPHWVVMIKARRHRPGRRVAIGPDQDGGRGDVVIVLRAPAPEGEHGQAEAGAWIVSVENAAGESTSSLLGRAGMTPLPPYILTARRERGVQIDDALDRGRYQTVYARSDQQAEDGPPEAAGSVAAPTAGLHLTPELLQTLQSHGIDQARLTLHVAAGTFKPVESGTVEEHPMHAEWCRVPPAARDAIFGTDRRLIAVGTTSVRTIEAHAALRDAGREPEGWFSTDLLIAPGYRWRRVEGLLTNFHLPRSTLLALVSAMLPGGIDQLRDLYRVAIERGYRFFSYGDAMLLLPE